MTHKVSCAIYDPVPDRCDCGGDKDWKPIPLTETQMAELYRLRATIEQQQARIKELEACLAESQANDRCGMMYLSQIRAIVGGDDFPDMVKRVAALEQKESGE